MKKEMIKRGLLGFPLGIAIGYVITILISVGIGQGKYAAVRPELVDTMGNELNAVILQTVLCGIMGTGFAMASVIWDIETWSLVKQSAIYFAIACAVMLPVAYVSYWMQHSVVGFLSYFGVFIAIFVFAWIGQYLSWKAKLRKMNKRVKNIE